MLLEDEAGVANVIVPPPVYERCRLAVRTAGFALVAGRLERRENVLNVVADSVERLSVPADAVGGQVRHIEPPAAPRDRPGPRAGARSLPSRLVRTASAGRG